MYDPEDDDYTVEDVAEDTDVSVEEAKWTWEGAEEDSERQLVGGKFSFSRRDQTFPQVL